MCGARYKAQIEHEIAAAASLNGPHAVDAGYDWYDRVVQLIAGIRGSESLLAQLLDLAPEREDGDFRWVPPAVSLLEEALPLAARMPDLQEDEDSLPGIHAGRDDSGPACPSSRGAINRGAINRAPTVNPSSLAEAIQVIQILPVSEEQRSVAMLSLRSLRDEMSRLDPRWEVVGPALIRLAGLGEEVFFPVVTWVIERRKALGLA